jgi:hypothetical protein
LTTLAILADIHGNLPALEAVLADLAGRPVDRVIVGGRPDQLGDRSPRGSSSASWPKDGM